MAVTFSTLVLAAAATPVPHFGDSPRERHIRQYALVDSAPARRIRSAVNASVHDLLKGIKYAFRVDHDKVSDVSLHNQVVALGAGAVGAVLGFAAVFTDREPFVSLLAALACLGFALANAAYVVRRYRRRNTPDDLLERTVNSFLDKAEDRRHRGGGRGPHA